MKTKKIEIMKQFYRDLPVLVTGGAGFIGSHITHQLVKLGAHVTVMDNFETGFSENLMGIQNRITIARASITDMQACLEATKGKKIIFHLAAFISVPASVQNPRRCHEVNIDGMFNILESARINGIQRFVFSSSAAVYGAQSGICEENMPCSPTSPYGTSKLIGELLCQQYAINYGINTVCLRYFNVFGERQNPNGTYAAAVAKFRLLMEQNKLITIFGNGLQTRDFIPVHEVVLANLTMGMQDEHIMDGSPLNVATGRSISLLELIELLRKEFPNYKQKPTFQPARKGDIKHSGADATKWKLIAEKIHKKEKHDI